VRAVSTTEYVLGSAIPRAPSATDVKPGKTGRFGNRFERSADFVRGTQNALSFGGLSQTSALTSGSVREGQPGRLCRVLSASRTDSLVRGPMTTGWQLTLAAARASALNDADDVSAFVKLRRSVRPAGVGHTSGCTNFGLCASFERHGVHL
jgi:hypothetical protein